MDKGMNFFYILSGPLGYVMEWIYKLLPSYGWDIIIFTLLINIVKIPLQLSQQKSMAKMSAFQPMMMEIQNKYKDKPEKQQEEMLKLQQDYGYNPTAGCVPIRIYQYTLSPWIGRSCRFSPSCSNYTMQAILTHGCIKGILLGAWRIARCNPLGKWGYDPVPPPGRWQNPARNLQPAKLFEKRHRG